MPGADLEHGRLPDPVLRTLSKTLDQQSRLEERVQELERVVSRLAPSAPPVPRHALPHAQESDIREALREVIEPEVGVNLVDLGLIEEITCNGRGVEVHMMLTHSGCSLAGYLVEQVRRRVRSIALNEPVKVVLVDKVWSWNDAAPSLFGGDGI
jgi:serine O-acetyltransferase